jgi:hypothetical protein
MLHAHGTNYRASTILTGGRLLAIGRREFAKLRDGGGDPFECVIDFAFGGVATEAETNAGASVLGGEADGGEDVRRFDGAGGARGSC